jgi:hypothetical protein
MLWCWTYLVFGCPQDYLSPFYCIEHGLDSHSNFRPAARQGSLMLANLQTDYILSVSTVLREKALAFEP